MKQGVHMVKSSPALFFESVFPILCSAARSRFQNGYVSVLANPHRRSAICSYPIGGNRMNCFPKFPGVVLNRGSNRLYGGGQRLDIRNSSFAFLGTSSWALRGGCSGF